MTQSRGSVYSYDSRQHKTVEFVSTKRPQQSRLLFQRAHHGHAYADPRDHKRFGQHNVKAVRAMRSIQGRKRDWRAASRGHGSGGSLVFRHGARLSILGRTPLPITAPNIVYFRQSWRCYEQILLKTLTSHVSWLYWRKMNCNTMLPGNSASFRKTPARSNNIGDG